MNRIQVILTINTDQLPDNFGEILKKEQEAVAIWKQAGFLEHLFLREEKKWRSIDFSRIRTCQGRRINLLASVLSIKKKHRILFFNQAILDISERISNYLQLLFI